MTKDKTSSFKKIVPLFKNHWGKVIVATTLVILSTVLTTLLPIVFREVIDNAIPARSFELILINGGKYLIVLILMIIVSYFQQIIVAYMGVDIVNGLKKRILKHVLDLSISFFDKTGSGKLISRIESDSQQLFMLFSSVGLEMIGAFLLIGISLGVMVFTSLKLTLIVFGLIPIYLIGTTVMFFKMRPMFKKDRKIYSQICGLLEEHIKAVPLLRSLGSLDWSKRKINLANEERRNFGLQIQLRQTGVWFILFLVPDLITAGILYKSVGWIKSNMISIGTVVMFIQYLEMSIRPLLMITEQIGELQRAQGAADRVFEILDTPSDNNHFALSELQSFNHEIIFENVSFSYNPETPVLKNVSFTVKKGETVAIVGATGSGKTTIISLLARFYEPTNGRIIIDGIDIKDITKTNLRSFISIVLQETYLFPGTVEDNLRVFRDDIDKDSVLSAIKYTGADKFINQMKGKIEADLSEDGRNLSFGERQLLSFSRALVFDPSILIMDEATSSVDPYTEKLIQEALEKMSRGRTSIIIAHRLSTIRKADKIIVVDDGRIVEIGKHTQLMDLKGKYSSLYNTQFGNCIV